jgi:predicted transcriptional regulator
MATVTFNLPRSLDTRFKALAKGKMLSKSAFLRQLMQERVEAELIKSENQKPRRAGKV